MTISKFSGYNECISYLFGLERAGIKYNLRNIRSLLKHIGNPERNFKSVHIAGTNGKGSVSSILNSILTERGFSTGLYTSPHILHFRERILVKGKFISKEFIIDFVNRIYKETERIRPSFFEVTTAMAFDYFSFRKVDYAVVETGLGGRLDATNVLIPLLSVITSISIDHTDFLGKSIRKISEEKAGIIKENIPVISGNVPEVSEKIFKKVSKQKKSELTFSARLYNVKITKHGENRFFFNVSGKCRKFNDFIFPFNGDYQRYNIKTAITAIDIFEKSEKVLLQKKHFYNGFKNIRKNSNFYGRFELISKNPKVVIDISHNLQGIENIGDNLKHIAYENLIIIFGMMNDKQYRESIRELFSLKTKKIIFTKPEYKRSAEPEDLLNSVKHADSGFEIKSNVKEAYEYAKSVAGNKDLILITGSFFLVSDFLKIRSVKYSKKNYASNS